MFGENNNWIFQQDNDPKHTSNVIKKYFANKKWEIMEWPAQSPDLNPIEHVWDQLEKAIRNRKPPKNTNELVSYLMEEWSNLDTDYLQKLVESMPQRVQAVIDSKGYPTKY